MQVTPYEFKACVLEYLQVNEDEFDELALVYGAVCQDLWRDIWPNDLESLREYYVALGQPYVASQARFALQTWDSHTPKVEGVGSVLDYGCGIGVPALWLGSQGAEVHLYDFDHACRQFAIYACRQFGIDPIVHDVKSLMDDLPSVDLITCVECIEHLPHPMEILWKFAHRAPRLWITHLLVDPVVEAKDPHPDHLKILPPEPIMRKVMGAFGYHQENHPLLWVRR